MSETQKGLQGCAPVYGSAATRNIFRILPNNLSSLHNITFLKIKDVQGTRRVGRRLYRNNIKINFEVHLICIDEAELNETVQGRAHRKFYVNGSINIRVS